MPLLQRLTPNDVPLLANVADDVFDDLIETDTAWRYLSDDNNILIVAIDAGRVVGQVAAVLHRHIDQRPSLYIDNLGVTPSHQRMGIASDLVKRALQEGKQMGAETAWIAVDSDNTAAHRVYESTGAASDPILMFSYEHL